MSRDFEVRGSRQLAEVAGRLKAAGDGGLRRELLKGIRKSGERLVPPVRESAARTLPQRGGLAERVAAQKFSIRTRLAGSNPSVRLAGAGMKELRDINRGRLRHPVFDNRDVWVQQDVEPGFFDDPVKRRAPFVRLEIRHVINDVARKIGRRL